MRKYKFFAHFNRINMQRGDPRVWTVHFRGQCIPCTSITFTVPTYTTYDPDGKQPRAKMVGHARSVIISGDGGATII
jgi:hypothetical protein